MVKRIAALALAVCMALPLFGCGGRIEAQCLTNGITAQTIDTRTDLTGDSTAVMDFAAALLRQTADEEGVLLSPVSLLLDALLRVRPPVQPKVQSRPL